MTKLCDFVQIVGNDPVTIGDPLHVWEQNFITEDRQSKWNAFLLFNVRGLTKADDDVDVKINNKVVGQIYRYGGLIGADQDVVAEHWYTQMVGFAGSYLNDGRNEIQIEAVLLPVKKDTFDDFQIKNMVCFYHLEVSPAN